MAGVSLSDRLGESVVVGVSDRLGEIDWLDVADREADTDGIADGSTDSV